MTIMTPLLAELVFEPLLPLFSPVTLDGARIGLAFGVLCLLATRSPRLAPALVYGLLAGVFAASVGMVMLDQLLLGLIRPPLATPASGLSLLQAVAGLLFGWGVGAMVGTYYGIFERSGRWLAWGLLMLRVVGVLFLLTILANPLWKERSIDPGRVVVVVDNSRSMSLAGSGGATRYERAKAAVDQLTKALEAKRDGSRVQVELFDITGAHQESLPPSPTVERTDLTHALQEATLRTRGGHLVNALVLVSDGMDNTGRKDFHDWEDASIPIHGLGFPKTESGDLDLAVGKPIAPERARVHNDLRIDVPVKKTGAPASNATVSLKLGRETLASQKISFGPGGSEQMVSLTFKPTQAGDFVFAAAVEADAAGERNLANNAAQFPIKIDAVPIRVIYLEGFLRYEYKYLKERMEDDPDVGLLSVVRRVNPERLDGKPDKELLTPDELKDVDVVILGDMEGKFLAASEYQAILRWLDKKDHSLLVLGGYKSFGPDGFRETPLADALPVVFAAAPPLQSEESFHLQLTEKGQGHPIFNISGDRVKDAAMWNDAPPLQGMSLVQHVKAGAEELAVNPGLSIDGKPAVVAAVQRAPGGGQVMVLTVDSTWRWSRLPRVFGQSEALYGRFWSQTLRFLAGRTHDDQRPLLTVSTDSPYYPLGKRVKVRVARQPRPDVDLTGAETSVEITGPDGMLLPANQTPKLVAGSAEPDVFTGEFTPTTAGRYELNAVLSANGKTLANHVTEFRAQGADYELADEGTNPGNLRALAEATPGGVYLDVDQAKELADKIVRKDRLGPERREAIWYLPLLFAAAFLLFASAEWFLRRWNHLV